MNRRTFLALAGTAVAQTRTEVSNRGDRFLINGKPTYAGGSYQGMKIEGLLMNVRAVQATFDDLKPETRSLTRRHASQSPRKLLSWFDLFHIHEYHACSAGVRAGETDAPRTRRHCHTR